MEETLLYPSPNWFLSSILGVTPDGWLVYGGPGKTIVVLEPISSEAEGTLESNYRYKTHVVNKCSKERVGSVDISPEWPGKRQFVTGSADGVVKEWTITNVENELKIRSVLSHEVHASEKEEVVTAGYSKGTHVISVGNFCNFVVWELNTNVVKSYNNIVKNFKATCMSCSPHKPMVVAVGTKQGVVFVVELIGRGQIIYKVRGQDEDISQVSWCPQYEVLLQRSLNVGAGKSLLTKRLEKIRNEPEPTDHETSGVDKSLPNDSFEESVEAQEDDMFDIYKDHEVSEFGHKKYEPEDIIVKIKDDSKKDDFLAECERLKAQILKHKNEEDESIETLVEAMDKAHVGEPSNSKSTVGEGNGITGGALFMPSDSTEAQIDSSAHVHKHLLASIGKNGSVRIWSKTGKIVATCAVAKSNNKFQQMPKTPCNASIFWHTPDVLLIADGKTQVLECNPLKIDSRNRLELRPVHSAHRRGIYCVTSSAPRVQDAETRATSCVWSVGQDRYLVLYDLEKRAVLAKYGTCGGFVYNIVPCPYDAGKLAVAVGDGSLRIWETEAVGEEDSKLSLGEVTCYWQNVQGKILQCAWHPTKENLLAFSTAESRVGIIDTGRRSERPARALPPALAHGVYSLAWGAGSTLYAVGGGKLVMYNASKPDQAPIPIQIDIEGQKWNPSVARHTFHGLTVGSKTGGVAVFTGPNGQALAAKFVFTKMIHAIEWHPQHTSNSDEESEYQNLLAVCAQDKSSTIVILHYEDKEGGGKQLTQLKSLVGHTHVVLQLYWSPHRDGQLLSTSQDYTVRVWDAINGVCVSVFAGHEGNSIGAAWCAMPQLADKVLSGGGDYTLRLWDINDYPAENYKESKKEPKKRKRNNYKKKTAFGIVSNEEEHSEQDNKYGEEKQDDSQSQSEDEAECSSEVSKPGKILRSQFYRYLMPIVSRQMNKVTINGPRMMLKKYLEINNATEEIEELEKKTEKLCNIDTSGLDYLKMFGTMNEINELLDMECESHIAQKTYDAYIMLMIFRGHIDTVIQFANEHDIIDSFLLSIAPCVSAKFWKDATQLYVAQIDRIIVQGQHYKLYEGSNTYGGPYYRKAAALLSVHDVKGAIDVLMDGKLFKEAYILCRCRHMGSLAESILTKWARDASLSGNLLLSSLLYTVLGTISNAAHILRRSTQQENLNLAAEIAKSAGLKTFAEYIETRSKSINQLPKPNKQTEELHELPTRIEVHIKENEVETKESRPDDIESKMANGIQTNDSEIVSKIEE